MSELAIFKRVAITSKVVLVCAQEQVYNGKQKQDVQLADISRSISLVLWEYDVGELKEGVLYGFFWFSCSYL